MTGSRYPGFTVDPETDPRPGDPVMGGERETLEEYLRYYRLTLAVKCDGLDAEQLARRSVPPSTMSLLGLVRHMAWVEQHWFHVVMNGEDVARHFEREGASDPEFDGAVADDGVVEEAFRLWHEEIEHAERLVAKADSLDVVGHHPRTGAAINLREVLVHMIEEYARHCGHADLLRECIDGATGE
ncbi:DinB family protein [Aeromicrobium massiliense]|uniref:DinB family protein n=1 Tax=Aeromicrobium massiliense TaxID=1464554 RepID=UPI000310985E|nr:DinB family protein [Aeromicrobium massiliense]